MTMARISKPSGKGVWLLLIVLIIAVNSLFLKIQEFNKKETNFNNNGKNNENRYDANIKPYYFEQLQQDQRSKFSSVPAKGTPSGSIVLFGTNDEEVLIDSNYKETSLRGATPDKIIEVSSTSIETVIEEVEKESANDITSSVINEIIIEDIANDQEKEEKLDLN